MGGKVMHAHFRLGGSRLLRDGCRARSSPSPKPISLFVSCADQAEVDRYWEALTADGGQEQPCALAQGPLGAVVADRPRPSDRADPRPRSRSFAPRGAGDAHDDARSTSPRSKPPQTHRETARAERSLGSLVAVIAGRGIRVRTARGGRLHPAARHPPARPPRPRRPPSEGWWRRRGRADDPRLRAWRRPGRSSRSERRRAHLAARQRHGARAHRRRRRCARSASFPASSPAASRACTASPSVGSTDDDAVAVRVPRRAPTTTGWCGCRSPATPGALSLGDAEAVFAGIPRATHPQRRPHRVRPGRPCCTSRPATRRTAMPPRIRTRSAARSCDSRPKAIRRRATRSATRSGRSGHRNVQGIAWTARRRRCGRASSARTRGTSSIASSPGRTTAGRSSRARRAMSGSSDPVVAWAHRARRARAASPPSATPCSWPVCAASGCGWSTSRDGAIAGRADGGAGRRAGAAARRRRRAGRHAVGAHEQHRRAGHASARGRPPASGCRSRRP